MSFIIDRLANIRGADKANRVGGKWMYRTEDSRATVVAADYFLNAYTYVPNTDTAVQVSSSSQKMENKFYVGDVIEVQQVDSSDRPTDSYSVVVVKVTTGGSATILVEELMPDEIVAVGQLADISTASNVDISFGQKVELTSIKTVLRGEIATADDTLTVKLDSSSGEAVEGGSLTVAYSGSAEGDEDTASPYANRTATTFNLASDGASTNTVALDIIMRGRVVEGDLKVVTVQLPDISSNTSVATIACPWAGTIKKIESTLQGAITVGDAALTTKIGTPAGGTTITNGGLTIAYTSSAAGDIDTATPSANNAVTEGDLLSVTTDGGSTDTAAAYVSFYILR